MNKNLICLLLGLFLLKYVDAKDLQSGITGLITNSRGQVVETALVWLVTPNSQESVAQDIPNEKGKFFIACVDKEVRLMITCLGYTPYVSEVFNAKMQKDFKTIVLLEEVQGLDEIVVLGKKKKPIIEQKAGKLVIMLCKNMKNTIPQHMLVSY